MSVCLSNKHKKKYNLTNIVNNNDDCINFECPICLEIIDSNSIIITCKHAYHRDCLEKWIQASVENKCFKCPLCNVKYYVN